MSYKNYLQGIHWQSVRKRFRNSKLSKCCYICGTIKNLNLHHKTYKRIGKEKLNDLIYLCQTHHYQTHNLLKLKLLNGSTRDNLWNIAKKLKKKIIR